MDDWPTADDVSGAYDFEEYEVAESESSEPRDRLSELPESLILLILSFLPMRYVIRTTLLSKRWKDLWTTVPYLDFSDDINDSGRLKDFVNRALILWRGTKILKFKIDFLFDMSLSSDLDLWLRFALENNVEELYIGLMFDEDVIMSREDAGYMAPLCLYPCSSIRKLTIHCGNLKIHGDLHWNQLKSLRIEGVCLSEHVVNQVLSGTPQLEVLKLSFVESYENLNIQSSSLKKLSIHKDVYLDDDPATATVLRIWAPNLETLMISGVLYSKCLLMNVSSLTDATLGFCSPKDDNRNKLLGEMLSQIFPTIHHAEKVTLSDLCIEVLGVMEKKYLLSSSSDVKFLKLNASFIELDKIVNLLEIFPKLKMLVVEKAFRENLFRQERHVREPLEFDAEPKSILLQLRTVEITCSLCDTTIFSFIEFLLKHDSVREKMVIRARRITSLAPESFFLASQKLLRMPRSSPIAEVILCKKLSSPSYVFQS